MNAFDSSVAAARDTGVQVFDTFKIGSWEHSYAVMIGNGNGLNQGDNDNNKDTYLYWSSEKNFSGKGP
ncbi:MAG: phosphate-selective porin O and P, partial [Gammaproteobacteria bacterium]|nr:phosphate-selective porin O and P [Gammaproteobacteria bacterium]